MIRPHTHWIGWLHSELQCLGKLERCYNRVRKMHNKHVNTCFESVLHTKQELIQLIRLWFMNLLQPKSPFSIINWGVHSCGSSCWWCSNWTRHSLHRISSQWYRWLCRKLLVLTSCRQVQVIFTSVYGQWHHLKKTVH